MEPSQCCSAFQRTKHFITLIHNTQYYNAFQRTNSCHFFALLYFPSLLLCYLPQPCLLFAKIIAFLKNYISDGHAAYFCNELFYLLPAKSHYLQSSFLGEWQSGVENKTQLIWVYGAILTKNYSCCIFVNS